LLFNSICLVDLKQNYVNNRYAQSAQHNFQVEKIQCGLPERQKQKA